MTKQEFLERLGKTGEVSFGESKLVAPTDVVREALADSLQATLPDDETIRLGVETSSFGQENWTGQLTWLLALKRWFLELTATVDKDPATREARAFKITQTVLSLTGPPLATIELEYRGKVRLALAEARLRIKDSVEVAGKRVTPRGLCQLFAAILSQGAAGP